LDRKHTEQATASGNLKNLLDLRIPALCRAGHNPQILRHLELAVREGVAEEDEEQGILRL